MPPSWALTAQMVVQASLMAISIALLIVVSVVFFGASAPKNPAGMMLAIALTIVAMFAIGLSIAGAARTAGAARALTAAAFYPLMFFSGLYYPTQLMPTARAQLRPHPTSLGGFRPNGPAIRALRRSHT